MHDSGDVAENSKKHIDAEVGVATALEEDTDRGKEDGEDDLDDITIGEDIR